MVAQEPVTGSTNQALQIDHHPHLFSHCNLGIQRLNIGPDLVHAEYITGDHKSRGNIIIISPGGLLNHMRIGYPHAVDDTVCQLIGDNLRA